MAQKFSPDDTMIEIMNDVSFYTDKNNNEDVYVEFQTINGGGYFGRNDSKSFLSVLSNEYRKRTGLLTDPDFETFVKIKSEDAIATQAAPVLIRHRLTGSFASYIRHKIACAGGSDSIIDPAALSAVHSHSQGNPRVIDNLMTEALLPVVPDLAGREDVRGVGFLPEGITDGGSPCGGRRGIPDPVGRPQVFRIPIPGDLEGAF